MEAATGGLVDAGAPLGAIALTLARRIDVAAVSGESGSSVAALTRELRATLDAAGTVRAADPVDELQSRREARLRAG